MNYKEGVKVLESRCYKSSAVELVEWEVEGITMYGVDYVNFSTGKARNYAATSSFSEAWENYEEAVEDMIFN